MKFWNRSSRQDDRPRHSFTRTRSPIRRRRLQLESLEERIVDVDVSVKTTLDSVAVNLRTGRDARAISLRSAIMAADAHEVPTRSSSQRSVYADARGQPTRTRAATGDLDITGKLSIKGSGSTGTIIDEVTTWIG